MDRISIVGMGLMGGSLGLALKARGFAGQIHGSSRSAERRDAALRRGAVDRVFAEAREAADGADLVVYCAPVLAIPALIKETLPALKPGCLLTDVGSTKEYIVREAESRLAQSSATFVGSHPIAGSELQGMEAAREDLYQGATVVVTPASRTPRKAVEQVSRFWQGVGGLVRTMKPAEHDRILARTSHLPHLAAAILVGAVARGEHRRELAAFCGSGFRDTTRVAEGSPDIWMDILQTNRGPVWAELKALRAELQRWIAALEKKDPSGARPLLERAREARRTLIRKID